MTPQTPNSESPWPHRLAMLLACATFPLIWVGGLVTTTQAGMAVPDWPSTYGYNLFLYPWQTWLLGPWDLFIEHGHRLLGATVGMIAIAFVVAVWCKDQRVWMRWLSLAALALVVLQGTLGGMRVVLDQRTLAQIHGCVGPAFFALAVALTVFTSDFWRTAGARELHPQAGSLLRLSVLTTLFAYVQLVLGSQLRHAPVALAPTAFRVAVVFHLVMAAVVAVHVLLLALHVLRHHRNEWRLLGPASALTGLVLLQVLLGCATWIVKYSWPSWMGSYAWAASHTVVADGLLQTNFVTAHVAAGSLIVALSLLAALRAMRLYRPLPGKSRWQEARTQLAGGLPGSRRLEALA